MLVDKNYVDCHYQINPSKVIKVIPVDFLGDTPERPFTSSLGYVIEVTDTTTFRIYGTATDGFAIGAFDTIVLCTV